MRLPVPTPPEFDALSQREVVVDGARITYTEAGEGPPVLMLHPSACRACFCSRCRRPGRISRFHRSSSRFSCRFYASLFHDPRAIAPARMSALLHACCAASSEPAHREAFLNTMRAIRGKEAERLRTMLRAQLADFARPTRLLAGREDPLFALSVIEAGAALLPGARLDALDACGHFPSWEHPARVAEALEEFALA